MTVEVRPGIDNGREATQRAIAGFRKLDELAAQRMKEEAERNKSEDKPEDKPEDIALEQAIALNELVDHGVQDLMVGAAQAIREHYPDVKVRITKPTGKRGDPMGIMLDFDHGRGGGFEVFRRISVFPMLSRLGYGPGFGITEGPLDMQKEHESGSEEGTYFIPYGDPDALDEGATRIGILYQTSETYFNPDQLVTIFSPRSLHERLSGPNNRTNEIARPSIEIEIPAVTALAEDPIS